MPAIQARYWILTIPVHEFIPYLPGCCDYIIGQIEKGNQDGYLHWQIVVYFKVKVSLKKVREVFGSFHCEPTKSKAANDYCNKDDTGIQGTRFELGRKSIKRANSDDWERVLTHAKGGEFNLIPADILIRNYNSLKRIHVDNVKPVAQEKEVFVFWGRTGSGKSKLAWEEASLQAYPKSPTSIWWCGYQQHENVVIDEFRGTYL